MIAIEGNIGAGKSTLLEAIGTWFPSESLVVPEPIDVWTRRLPGLDRPVTGNKKEREECEESPLGKFYSDPKKNALAFQVFVASSKVRDLFDRLAAFETARGRAATPGEIFCERDPFDVDIFPRLNNEEGLFDDFQLGVMRHLLETLGASSNLPRVTASVYLRAEPDVCLERVAARGRAEERSGGVGLEKLRRIHRLHEAKFINPDVNSPTCGRPPPVLVLDASAPVESHRCAVMNFVRELAETRRPPPGAAPTA